MGSMLQALQADAAARAWKQHQEQARAAAREAAGQDWQFRREIGATIAREAAERERRAIAATMDNDLLASAVHTFAVDNGGSWTGTAAELLPHLDVPLNVIHLGRRLRKAARLLRRCGVSVRLFHGGPAGRRIVIRSIG
jgi:hypothetical protein